MGILRVDLPLGAVEEWQGVQHNIIQKQVSFQQEQMDEYEQNIDDYGLFGCLVFEREQQSECISIHSLSSPSSSLNQQSPLFDTKALKSPATFDKTQPSLLSNPIHSSQPSNTSKICLDEEQAVRNRRRAVFQGSKDDTVELNINFKTIIYNHLKSLALNNQLTHKDVQRLLLFGKRPPSFKSLQSLWDAEEGGALGELCLKLVCSSLVMRQILGSGCRHATKLQMIKFVEKLRLNVATRRVVKWKHQLHI